MHSSVGTNQAGHAVLKLMQFSDRLTPGSEVYEKEGMDRSMDC